MSVADRVRDPVARRPRCRPGAGWESLARRWRAWPPVGGWAAFGPAADRGTAATPGGPPRDSHSPACRVPCCSAPGPTGSDHLPRRAGARGPCARARGTASTRSASRRPSRCCERAPPSRSARPPACTPAWTSRSAGPVRSTTPSELVEGAAAIVVGARRYESILPPRPDARGPYGAVARYAWTDHYGPLREALGTVAAHLQAERVPGAGAGRRQRPGRPRGRAPRRTRLVREERQPAASRSRARGSCWAAS